MIIDHAAIAGAAIPPPHVRKTPVMQIEAPRGIGTGFIETGIVPAWWQL